MFRVCLLKCQTTASSLGGSVAEWLAPDLKFVGRGFKSRSDRYGMLFLVARSSTSRLRL